MKKVSLTLISCAALVTGAVAQKATPLSLQACMDYAMKNSATIKNAQLDVLIQQAQVDQTKALALPKINGKLDFNNFNIPQRSFIDGAAFSPTPLPPGTPPVIVPVAFTLPYAASANITTSQILFDGSVLVALQAREAVMDMARKVNRATETGLRYNIFKAYNSLVIAYRQYDILKSSLAYARSMANDAEVLRASGFAEKIDVDRAAVQVNNLASDSMRIGNMLTMTEQVLKYTIGMDINAPIVLTDTNITARTTAATSLLASEGDYESVPEYGIFTQTLRLNEYNLKRYKLSALPSVAGFWSYGSNYGSLTFKEITKLERYWANSTLGIQVNVPIFNGFTRVQQMKEAKLNIEKAKNNIDNMKLTIDFQKAQARTSLKNAILQVQSQDRNVQLSNDVLELARKKYKAGVGSNLEVTQAQTEQLRAQASYFSTLLEVVAAEADLKKALGQMDNK